MKMTKEEAIAQIEKLKSYCEYMKDSDENGAYVFDLDVQALDFVLSALHPITREQVEKVWKGEWKPTESPYMNECEECSVCGYRTPWGYGFRFCPGCGAAQTDEAVDMVMERLEALYDKDM